jgi:hypothetical protein
LRALRLTTEDFVIRLSSRRAWQELLSARGCAGQDAYQFYQVIDKLEREEESVSQAKLAKLGFKLDDVKTFITASRPTPELGSILGNLTARGLGGFVKIDYNVIRGLAYYTGVVFEAFDQKGEFRAIAGGGRYDNLIKLMSGGKVDLPALGFGMGDVVLLELLKVRGLLPKFGSRLDAFVLIEDESLRADSLKLIAELRTEGWCVDYCFTPLKPDKQFKRALELNAACTCKLGRDNNEAIVCRVKALVSREEKAVAPRKLPACFASFLSRPNRAFVMRLLWLIPLGWSLLASHAAEVTNHYEFRQIHEPDGIGKFYMGREIARVMGHQAADWLERPERDEEEHTESWSRKSNPFGDVVADIGCGTGYFSRRLAKRSARKAQSLPWTSSPRCWSCSPTA